MDHPKLVKKNYKDKSGAIPISRILPVKLAYQLFSDHDNHQGNKVIKLSVTSTGPESIGLA
jgi:hypothetical protein